MKITKGLIAVIILLIYTANMIDAAPIKTQILKPGPVGIHPPVQVLGPSIDIAGIHIAGAAAGNSNQVNVALSITQYGKRICGLDSTNFRLETLAKPIGGADVVISLVGIPPWMYCYYIIYLVPTTYQGKQYAWLAGNYTVKIFYIKDGKELANNTVPFAIQ